MGNGGENDLNVGPDRCVRTSVSFYVFFILALRVKGFRDFAPQTRAPRENAMCGCEIEREGWTALDGIFLVWMLAIGQGVDDNK